MNQIEITGAQKHNLKNISLTIPKKQFICITGVSGSGKSSLAFDTIFQEGQRKYIESLSIYARQFIKSLEKPDVQSIKGISPTISIDQKHASFYYNSTVGTISEISHYLRLLFARTALAHCPQCGREIQTFSSKKVADYIFHHFPNHLVYIYAPVVKNRKGSYKSLFEKYQKRGFLKARIDGEIHYLDDGPELNRHVNHHISILIDAVKVVEQNRRQLEESTALASFESHGETIVICDRQELFFSNKLYCPHCEISIPEPQPATFSLNSPIAVCPTCMGRGTIEDQKKQPCTVCSGSGFNRWALSFYFHGKNIFQVGELEIRDLLDFFQNLSLTPDEQVILAPIIPQIIQRLKSFVALNLGYISLNRKIDTLSGGELQRTRLVSQIGFSLSGIIYILDEPSIGMHMSEQQNLVDILKELKQKDNTVIVVEHDAMTIQSSDFIIDLGPHGGEKGGYLTFCGWVEDFPKAHESLTAQYLFNPQKFSIKKNYKWNDTPFISLQGICINNITNADIRIPTRALTVVTGVSGSGKSSLIIDAFYPLIKSMLDDMEGDPDSPGYSNFKYSKLEGLEGIGRVMMVTQTPIGKNARSCPATYIDLMPMMRQLFAASMESKIRGYGPSRFSFNVKGGRCEACGGLGYKKLEMSFLPQMDVACPICGGKRFNSETLRAKYKGFSIADVLELTAAEAYELFRDIPPLAKKIKILLDVGLGYLRLGQSSVTLSGGESQRIKLTRELSRLSTKTTIYVMDEPTVGLHFDDIQKLLDVLYGLILKGNTVVVIEHNMQVIRAADYIIDMGPGGGKYGGRVLYQGEPGGLVQVKESVTGRYWDKEIQDI